MNRNNYVVIMAGGVGTRFWPFSRTNFPKQFHDVLGTGKTLLQQTAERFEGVCPSENIYIVTSQEYKELVQQQLPYLSAHQILLEPTRRNTAPCIAYACYKIAVKNPEANIVVAPADHIILKEQEFKDTIRKALAATAEQNILITLGIKPSRPDTGYGYIQYIPQSTSEIKKVKTFTEKPHLELAKKFIESGEFVWNSGIFIWNAQAIIQNFDQHLHEVAELFEEGKKVFYTDEEESYIKKTYSFCKNISIDYGIMEKSEEVYVLLSDFGWSDLGTWKSLYDVSEKDSSGNVIDGQVMTYNTTNCIIKTPKDRLVVAQGLEGYIVAEFDNVLLICKKDEEQKVKDFVADAKSKGAEYI
ncbi:mannose-1-phosphate guanylyltransferase [Rhodocytophaga aerolata]|uniref:Mannose-1-phosphate guanylyltransferase n=1 Tax=Rhodocytophaga aerolata TaxID=455078 RepID=A0ABT8QZN1_9BACT|nr:mannose-1-phosphate guanylyltransferase [Rhodocytophaga aerolata]MDO1444866.1 mannose-1-phosphate guanylyltransferase [Rhodocytophaga aerolata]